MPKKLTSEDKEKILLLYRQSEETTSTLASRYGVSNSTISRFLKTSLPEAEYELLIQQKRNYRRTGDDLAIPSPELPSFLPKITFPNATNILSLPKKNLPARNVSEKSEKKELEVKVRQRSGAIEPPTLKLSGWQDLPLTEMSTTMTVVPASNNLLLDKELLIDREVLDAKGLTNDLHDLTNLAHDLEDDLDDLSDDSDDWGEIDEDEEDLDLDDLTLAHDFPHTRGENVQVMPLSVQELPKVCYLVVDRASELIAKPLKDFSDLGQIPIAETQEKTLPVFDHHKVAQRFSNRFQKVIKVPDGQMLHKTRFHLHAKGITRLLINGQVYSLV
ncbi:MAG: transposase [Coleofasciculaceae cyanobacterium SM2_1_6]|nr:transposase [Coleofasciculaceae cyanobacterium SM2_1_6]